MTSSRRRAFSPLPDLNKDLFCTCLAWLNLFPATLFVSLAKEGVPAVRYLLPLLLPDIFRSPKSHRISTFQEYISISKKSEIINFSPHHLRSHCQRTERQSSSPSSAGGRLLQVNSSWTRHLFNCATLPPRGEGGGSHQRRTPPPHPPPPQSSSSY